MKAEKREKYIDYLNVVSALAVVFLHANGVFWYYSTERYWTTADVIESVFYFGVPVFFMIIGATSIDYQKKYDTKTFFKKRFFKIVIPYIFWSFVGMIFVTRKLDLQYFIVHLLTFDSIAIYWFFRVLFSAYLLIPILSCIPDEKKMQVFKYIFACGFVLNSFFPFVFSFIKEMPALPLRMVISTECGGYICLGYLISHGDMPKKKTRYLIYLAGILGLIMHIVGTYFYSRNDGAISYVWKGYENVPCILYSAAIFLLFKSLEQRVHLPKLDHLISILRKYTFSLYLMQIYILWLIVKVTNISIYSIYYRLGSPIIVLLITIGITKIMRKIPIIKYFVP